MFLVFGRFHVNRELISRQKQGVWMGDITGSEYCNKKVCEDTNLGEPKKHSVYPHVFSV
jgi:hypothetical protein